MTSNILYPSKEPREIIIEFKHNSREYISKIFNSHHGVNSTINYTLLSLKSKFYIKNIYFMIDALDKYNVYENIDKNAVSYYDKETYALPLQNALTSLVSYVNNIHETGITLIIIRDISQIKIGEIWETTIDFKLYEIGNAK